MPHMQRIDELEPDVAVDAASRGPARVRRTRIVDAHGDDVDAGHYVRGNVVSKARVAVGPPAERDAVDPDVAVHVDAVELEPRRLAARTGRHPKRLAVPADTRREVPHPPTARRILPRRPLDAPVVRQAQQVPLVVVEVRSLSARGVPSDDTPAGAH